MSAITKAIDAFMAAMVRAASAPPAFDLPSSDDDVEAALYPATEPSRFEPLSNTSGLRCEKCKAARAIFQCRLCGTTVCVECECCPDVLEVQP